MASLESAIVERIVKLLERRGAWLIKSTGVSLVGCPDIICCYKSYFLGIEVKREEDGKYGVTKKQRYELGRILKAGGYGRAVSSVDEVAKLLDSIDSIVQP